MPFLWACRLQSSFFSSCTVSSYWYGKSLPAAHCKVFYACRLQLRDKRWGAVSARPVACCSVVTVRWLLLILTETADVDGWYNLRQREIDTSNVLVWCQWHCAGSNITFIQNRATHYMIACENSCENKIHIWTLHGQSGYFVEEINVLPLLIIEPWMFGLPAHSLVVIPPEPSQLCPLLIKLSLGMPWRGTVSRGMSLRTTWSRVVCFMLHPIYK